MGPTRRAASRLSLVDARTAERSRSEESDDGARRRWADRRAGRHDSAREMDITSARRRPRHSSRECRGWARAGGIAAHAPPWMGGCNAPARRDDPHARRVGLPAPADDLADMGSSTSAAGATRRALCRTSAGTRTAAATRSARAREENRVSSLRDVHGRTSAHGTALGQAKAVAVLPGGDAPGNPGTGDAPGPLALLDHAAGLEGRSRADRQDAGHQRSRAARERVAGLPGSAAALLLRAGMGTPPAVPAGRRDGGVTRPRVASGARWRDTSRLPAPDGGWTGVLSVDASRL